MKFFRRMIPVSRIDLLKFIDHWLGFQICFLLSALEQMTHPLERISIEVKLKAPPRSFVVIKFFGLGSVLLSSDFLCKLKDKYPGVKIIFLTFEENVKFMRILNVVDEVRSISTRNPWALLLSIFDNLFYFSFNKPDVAFDLEFFSKFSTIMTYLTGARWRVGFHMNHFWRMPLINVSVYFNYSRHILDIYALCGRAVGVEMSPQLPDRIHVNEKNLDAVDAYLEQKGVGKKTGLIGVNVNASDLAYCRRWPLERFAEVINCLLKKNDSLRVVLTGTKSEKSYVARIFSFLDIDVRKNVLDLSGQLTLEQFIALLDRVDVFLTNDSGPFHIAQVQRVPMVSIWGAGSPDLYGHYGLMASTQRVIYSRWPCSPCLYIFGLKPGIIVTGQPHVLMASIVRKLCLPLKT